MLKQPELKWGLIAGAICVGRLFVEYLTGFYQNPLAEYTGYLALLVIAGGLVGAQWNRRKSVGTAAFTYGQAFRSGMFAAFISGIIIGGGYYIYYAYLNTGAPDSIAKSMIEYYTKLKEKPENIARYVSDMRSFYSPGSQFVYGSGAATLFGLIVCILSSAVVMKKAEQA